MWKPGLQSSCRKVASSIYNDANVYYGSTIHVCKKARVWCIKHIWYKTLRIVPFPDSMWGLQQEIPPSLCPKENLLPGVPGHGWLVPCPRQDPRQGRPSIHSAQQHPGQGWPPIHSAQRRPGQGWPSIQCPAASRARSTVHPVSSSVHSKVDRPSTVPSGVQGKIDDPSTVARGAYKCVHLNKRPKRCQGCLKTFVHGFERHVLVRYERTTYQPPSGPLRVTWRNRYYHVVMACVRKTNVAGTVVVVIAEDAEAETAKFLQESGFFHIWC